MTDRAHGRELDRGAGADLAGSEHARDLFFSLDDEVGRLEPIDNPFGPKLLPMWSE